MNPVTAGNTAGTPRAHAPWLLLTSFALVLAAGAHLLLGEDTPARLALALLALVSSGVVMAAEAFRLPGVVARAAAALGLGSLLILALQYVGGSA